MLTSENYFSVQTTVMENIDLFFSSLKRYKSCIQFEIIRMTTQQELNDIKNCRLNHSLIDKLAILGKKHYYASDKNDTTLYCICMAIGTIIKEYDWGIEYISKSGMCTLAQKIVY